MRDLTAEELSIVLEGCPTGRGCDSIACRMAREIDRRRDCDSLYSAFIAGAHFVHDHAQVIPHGGGFGVEMPPDADIEKAARAHADGQP